jgi:predicted nucleic acid-binding protein
VNLYAESSAVLSWLLDEASGPKIRQLLVAADSVVASDLTIVECDRVLQRAVALGELTEAEAADRRAHLNKAASHWHVLRLGPEIVERARQPFPGEPIRTLDALHLAAALVARSAIAGLELLSLDDRIRKAARAIGLRVRPEYPERSALGTPLE